MKCEIVLLMALGTVWSAPQYSRSSKRGRSTNGEAAPRGNNVETLVYGNTPPMHGSYFFTFELDNGIAHQEEGMIGLNSGGSTIVQGKYSFPLDNGEIAEVKYTADENGFMAESPLLPVAPPNPIHVESLLQLARDQREAGIFFDQRGFRIN